uniref:Uncharacterized protein n=1 Tax=Eutreptiella gymnastica TaxID=73025 RepID=A0A7S1I7X7_9EUGL
MQPMDPRCQCPLNMQRGITTFRCQGVGSRYERAFVCRFLLYVCCQTHLEPCFCHVVFVFWRYGFCLANSKTSVLLLQWFAKMADKNGLVCHEIFTLLGTPASCIRV